MVEKLDSYGKEYLTRKAFEGEYADFEDPSDANGFMILDIDKIEAVISYIAESISDLFKVKLMKMLWYVDVFSYKRNGHAMTGMVYRHNTMGVLPVGHYRLMNLENLNVREEESYNYNSMLHIYPTKGRSIGCSNVTLPNEDDGIILKRREKLLEYRNCFVIGSAGKVDMKYKGYQYVIKAINKMREMNIQIKYELVGGGDETFLRNIAKKEGVENFVSFKGVKPHDEVLQWMDTLDLYIQPSNTEGLPRSLIEAMSRGCPCVGSDAGGIPELLDPSCIFKKKNIGDLIKVIQYVINNMRACSDMCYEKAKEYKIQTIVKRRNEFFDLFIEENSLGYMQNEKKN